MITLTAFDNHKGRETEREKIEGKMNRERHKVMRHTSHRHISIDSMEGKDQVKGA